MPSAAQRCTTEVGSPRKCAICCHPLRTSVGLSALAIRFGCYSVSMGILKKRVYGSIFLTPALFVARIGEGATSDVLQSSRCVQVQESGTKKWGAESSDPNRHSQPRLPGSVVGEASMRHTAQPHKITKVSVPQVTS